MNLSCGPDSKDNVLTGSLGDFLNWTGLQSRTNRPDSGDDPVLPTGPYLNCSLPLVSIGDWFQDPYGY